MIDKETIGSQLKDLRLSRGWTQAMLSDRVGLSRPAISNIESGKRAMTLDTLKRFCEVYKIDISYFGIDTKNFEDAQDLTARLEKLFRSEIDDSQKDELYRSIMQIYLDSKR